MDAVEHALVEFTTCIVMPVNKVLARNLDNGFHFATLTKHSNVH